MWLVILIFVLYILAIGSAVFFHQKIKSKHDKLLHEFEWEVDKWLYLYCKSMYESQKDIHDYENNVDVLFANKHMMMKESGNYVTHYEEIKSDMWYLGQLVSIDIVNKEEFGRVDQSYDELKSLIQHYKKFGWLIKIFSLWMYHIREPDLLS